MPCDWQGTFGDPDRDRTRMVLQSPPPPTELIVFAAASLTEAFEELGARFERAHPGVRVRFSFAGSQQLVSQLEQGAQADLLATADQHWMDGARRRAVVAGESWRIAHNDLVVIVPRANPGRIARLQDLARPGVKLVRAAEAVPVGRYTRQMLEQLGRLPNFPPDFAKRVTANTVSLEDNVRGVMGKVQLGEADAGIVYRSDVPGATAQLHVLEVPPAANVVATYFMALTSEPKAPALAREFVALVRSDEGQAVLERHGLQPASAGAATP